MTVRVLLLGVEVLARELLLEALNATQRVDKGLLTSEERVRARPNFDIHRRNRGADGHDDLAAKGNLALRVIGRVGVLLHSALQSRPIRGSGKDREVYKGLAGMQGEPRIEPEFARRD